MKSAQSAYEIIVIDDCSKDKSSAHGRNYIAAHPDERILLRTNLSQSRTGPELSGCRLHRKRKYYRLICGDNAEPQATMVAVFREIGNADMVIPYYVSSEGKEPLPPLSVKCLYRIGEFD